MRYNTCLKLSYRNRDGQVYFWDVTSTTRELPSLRHLARQTLARLLHGAPVRLPDGSWCSRGSSSSANASPQSSASDSAAGTGSLPSPPSLSREKAPEAAAGIARASLLASFPARMPFIGQTRDLNQSGGFGFFRWMPHRVTNLFSLGTQLLPLTSRKKSDGQDRLFSSPVSAAATTATSRSHESLHQHVPQNTELVGELPDSESPQENSRSGSTQSLPQFVQSSALAINDNMSVSDPSATIPTPLTQRAQAPEFEGAARAENLAKMCLFQPDVPRRLRSYVLFTNDEKYIDRFAPNALNTAESELF